MLDPGCVGIQGSMVLRLQLSLNLSAPLVLFDFICFVLDHPMLETLRIHYFCFHTFLFFFVFSFFPQTIYVEMKIDDVDVSRRDSLAD